MDDDLGPVKAVAADSGEAAQALGADVAHEAAAEASQSADAPVEPAAATDAAGSAV